MGGDFEGVLKVEPTASVTPPRDDPSHPMATAPEALGREVSREAVAALAEQLLVRKGPRDRVLEQDKTWLKAQLNMLTTSGKHQQFELLALLGEIKAAGGDDYPAMMIKNELQRLIPMNAMLINLLRNTPKVELE